MSKMTKGTRTLLLRKLYVVCSGSYMLACDEGFFHYNYGVLYPAIPLARRDYGYYSSQGVTRSFFPRASEENPESKLIKSLRNLDYAVFDYRAGYSSGALYIDIESLLPFLKKFQQDDLCIE